LLVRFHLGLSAAFLTLAVFPAAAGALKLQVADQGGKPLVDAVATLTPETPDNAPRPAPREHFIDQKDETFQPLVEIVTTGDAVIFRNSDRTRHHVYTFSPLGQFEFVLKPNESSTPVRLQKPGVIPVGCNIHDFMINYIFVTDSRWAAKSDAQGVVTLNDVPPGNYTIKWWHPRQRPGAAAVTQTVTIGGDQSSASATVPVMAPPARDDTERERY
jgi:plastocyanin